MARPSNYTEHRDKILSLIYSASARHSLPPTVRALAEELGVGVATVHSYLGKLAEEGLVKWQPKSHRSLQVTRSGFHRLMSPAQPQP